MDLATPGGSILRAGRPLAVPIVERAVDGGVIFFDTATRSTGPTSTLP
jgi:hypothetical protein